jgi:hypothetical protein
VENPASLLFRDGGIGADLLDLGDEALALCGLVRPLEPIPQIAHLALTSLPLLKITLWLTSHSFSLPPDSRGNLSAGVILPPSRVP